MTSENDRYNLRPNPKPTDKRLKNKKGPNQSEDKETERATTVQIHADPDQIDADDQGAEEAGVTMETMEGDEGAEQDMETEKEERAVETVVERQTAMDPNTQILLLLQNLTESQNKKFNQLTESQNKLTESQNQLTEAQQQLAQTQNEKLNKLTESQNQLTEAQNTKFERLQDNISRMEERMIEKQINLQEQIQTQLVSLSQNQEHMTETMNNLKTDLTELRKETEEKLITQNFELYDHVKNTVEQVNQTIRTELNEIVTVRNEDLNRKIDQLDNKTTENIRTIRLETDEFKSKMTELTNNMTQNQTSRGEQIYVTCTGGSNLTNLPTFNGRSKDPLGFLDKFKAYLRGTQPRLNNGNGFNVLLENCLLDSASRWWQMVRGEVETLEEFESKFLEKYWNSDIQRGIRRRVETERYRPGGYLTKSDYFIERVMTLKRMTPVMDEEDIVTTLTSHFDRRIQDAVRVQNITTINGFERLLNREDIEERNVPSNQPKISDRRPTTTNYKDHYPRPNQERQHNTTDRQNFSYRRPNYQPPTNQNYNYREHNRQNQPRFQQYPTPSKYPSMEQQRTCQLIQSDRIPYRPPTHIYNRPPPSYQNNNTPINNPTQNIRPNTTDHNSTN